MNAIPKDIARKIKVPVYPMKDLPEGTPFIHQAGHYLRENHISEQAAKQIEQDPWILVCRWLVQNRVKVNTATTQASQPVVVLRSQELGLMDGWNDIFVLKDELTPEAQRDLSEYNKGPFPYNRELILCTSEWSRQQWQVTEKLQGEHLDVLNYKEPPSKDSPYQAIHGRPKHNQVYHVLCQAINDYPDLFELPFADLGGGFGWPTFFWAQLVNSNINLALLEKNPLFLRYARQSHDRLSSHGLSLNQVKIIEGDFFAADLSPYGALHIYRPFATKDPIAPPWDQIILEHLDRAGWQGKYIMTLAGINDSSVLKRLGYRILIKHGDVALLGRS